MKIEIITTGDELMSGLTRDGNFFWTGDALASLGFGIDFHATVGDDRENIAEALRIARIRADAVIVSGGLGPTPDDLTSEVAAGFVGVPLELSGIALRTMEERLASRGRSLTETNKKQAYLPRGSRVLINRWGTAPGFSFDTEGTVFYFLPGVPKEFRAMMREYVIPELEERGADRKHFRSKLVKTYGLPESELARMLEGTERDGVRLGYRSHFPEVHLRISSFAETDSDAGRLMAEFLGEIERRLGDCVFSTEGETMEEVVGKLLVKNGRTLATAESCTGGLIAHRITNVPGSSDYFLEGVISYSNEAKVKILGVSEDMLNTHGAVSAPVAEAMAHRVRRLSGADIGVSVTGIAGPGGGSDEKPVGTVFIAIDHGEGGPVSGKFLFNGTREEIKLATSERALDTIRKIFLNNV